MDDGLANAINDQIKHELESAYFYLSVSGYFESANLGGFAHWMQAQSREELGHAMKFFRFLNDRQRRAQLQSLQEPAASFGSPLQAFEQALDKERQVTALIHSLYELAMERKDYAAQVLLQWFVQEQVEEEKTLGDIAAKLQMADGSFSVLLLLDQELGSRTAG